MRDDRFEWDDAKAASNLRKHGVSFEQAREAFDDPDFIEEADDNFDEQRWRLIGMTKAGLLFVVHTERGRRNRIISAREADHHEQDRYRRQSLSER
jgi:uncharacterized protein